MQCEEFIEQTAGGTVVIVGHDHVLGPTLDGIAQALTDRGMAVCRLPKACLPAHCQVPAQGMGAALSRAEVIVVSSRTVLDGPVFERMPQLKVAVFPTIGYNSCDIEAASRRGILVVNGVTPENYESMAESTVMLFSALMLQLYRKQLISGQPYPCVENQSFRGHMLKGKTVGLVGYGKIARETVVRLQGWGIREFLVYTRTPGARQDGRVRFCDLPQLLEKADILSIHCPFTPQTHHLIGTAEIAMMKPSAVVVNTSRGGIIDEQALCRALREGRIAAAAIDTVAVEPIVADHPLRALPNVILTQHNIGHTWELFDSLVPMGVTNVMTVLEGRLPANTVNQEELLRLHKATRFYSSDFFIAPSDRSAGYGMPSRSVHKTSEEV